MSKRMPFKFNSNKNTIKNSIIRIDGINLPRSTPETGSWYVVFCLLYPGVVHCRFKDRNGHSKVKAAFEKYFVPTKNVIYKRYKFISWFQEEGETVEKFVTSLYSLVKTRDFPASFQDKMIRDRIVCGIRDKKVSERLQLEMELTLDKAINTVRQAETVKKQQEAFENNSVNNMYALGKAARVKNVFSKPEVTNNLFTGNKPLNSCYCMEKL
ncbi:uncharacterized protein LOC111625755 [Centruroides sculpturatus]|uniref:uncharacterized protein LOC111625755 n=1 Tax=Centruroides sculpturatus TaxID=218467 RepID=UPI000C6DB64E|nr:uncharacterized protein LOC111625755 [Centruroides sculpturatus]